MCQQNSAMHFDFAENYSKFSAFPPLKSITNLFNSEVNYNQRMFFPHDMRVGEVLFDIPGQTMEITQPCNIPFHNSDVPPFWSFMTQIIPNELYIKDSDLNPEAPPYIPKSMKDIVTEVSPTRALDNQNDVCEPHSENTVLSYAEVVKKLTSPKSTPQFKSPQFSPRKPSMRTHMHKASKTSCLPFMMPYDDWNEIAPKYASQQKFEKTIAKKLKYHTYPKVHIGFDQKRIDHISTPTQIVTQHYSSPPLNVCSSYTGPPECPPCTNTLISFIMGNDMSSNLEFNNFGFSFEPTTHDHTEESDDEAEIDYLKEINDKWNKLYTGVCSKAEDDPCKVKFNDGQLVTIHEIIDTDSAYKEARIGKWEEMARDRVRFQDRIANASKIISPILSLEHREKIYSQLLLNGAS